MLPQEYIGLNFRMEYSPTADGQGFVEVGKVYNLSPSTDNDDVTRNFIDGTSLKLNTNYVHSLEFTVSKVTADNLKAVVPQNVYEEGDAIDGVVGAKAGDGGAIQAGEQISGKATQLGTLRLTPLNGAQKPIYMLNTTVAITDTPMDDNLAELTLTATADKVIYGNLTFGS